jgi:hypothetical protein
MRLSRCSELSQATAVSVLVNRWRMTQSACAGGLGGITVCLMKPGNCATVLLVSSCQRAKAFMLSGRTRVCVTMVTAPLALPLATGDTSPVVRSLSRTAARPAC